MLDTLKAGPEASKWRDIDPSEFLVLLADDHAEIRSVVDRALRSEGYQVDQATDGVEVLERAAQSCPDLVVLDIMMPRLDGLEALARLRADPRLRSAYVILLTGKSSLEEKVEGLDRGADDYLTKPFQIAELKARVRSGIRLRAMQRSLDRSHQVVIRQEKMATIGLLAAGIAHEFNNIMSAITGYAQLARSNEKHRERLVEVALEQAKRAHEITSSLSSFASNAVAGTQRTMLGSLVSSALCLLNKELRNRQIAIEVEIDPALPPVTVNAGQIQQVLVHVLLNAIQAVGKDGRIQVRGAQGTEGVCLEIDDSGSGIPDHLRHAIFDPFFTTKGALGSAEEPGTGLGLSFSQNIVQGHGGTITLAPSRLGGACLCIELPAADAAAGGRSRGGRPSRGATAAAAAAAPSAGAAPAPAPVREDPPLAPAQVVVIEDDPTLCELFGELFAAAPAVFRDGPRALEHCRAHLPQVVILDLHLEGPWSGEEVLAELSRLPAPPPVLITTGDVEVNEHAPLPPPAVAVLKKPFTLEELEGALRPIIGTTLA